MRFMPDPFATPVPRRSNRSTRFQYVVGPVPQLVENQQVASASCRRDFSEIRVPTRQVCWFLIGSSFRLRD